MTARTKLAPEEQMTIEEFLAYTDTRPDGERWELIEGVAIMNPSLIDDHQTIVANLITALMLQQATDRCKLVANAGHWNTRSRLPLQTAAARRLCEGDAECRLAYH